jgi:hypothetical protein
MTKLKTNTGFENMPHDYIVDCQITNLLIHCDGEKERLFKSKTRQMHINNLIFTYGVDVVHSSLKRFNVNIPIEEVAS